MEKAVKLIDRTNRFYIEISKKVLSEKEHDILQKLLIEKKTLTEVGDNYGINAPPPQDGKSTVSPRGRK